jgi:energy-coupling factor transporter ATP-binding protein EcfA2
VYIGKISLKNIRGFRSLEFDLDRGNGEFAGWTVFTGSNGSGKSTLLKAIAYCLIPPVARDKLLNPGYLPRKNPAGDELGIDLRFSRCEADDEISDTTRWQDRDESYWEGVSFRPPLGVNVGGIFTWKEYEKDASYRGWFSCGYGPFRRITAPKENVEQIQKTKDTERFATLLLEGATLSEVDPWLTQLRFQQLEGSKSSADQLSSFLDLARDSLLPDGFSVDRVDSKGLWLKDSNGVELSWFDMSDGHRSAVILLADILRHMIAAYGFEGLYDRDADGKIFIKRSGVVLIDEIDAHLHPSWQREIGFWLKRHFPAVQFLVTSHSPIILQAADPNGLFVLPEPGSDDEPRALTPEEYQTVVASRPDSILLSPAFGLENTRSEPVVEKRARYSRLQAKKHAGAKLFPNEENELESLIPFVETGEEV